MGRLLGSRRVQAATVPPSSCNKCEAKEAAGRAIVEAQAAEKRSLWEQLGEQSGSLQAAFQHSDGPALAAINTFKKAE